MGHNVVTAGWIPNTFGITVSWGLTSEQFYNQIKAHFEPDLLIYFDNSSLPAISDLENLPIPKIFFSVDTFHHLSWHGDFAKFFNLTLIAQKDYVDAIRSIRGGAPDSVDWFPLWSTEDLQPEEIKTCDVSFRGTLDKNLHPARHEFFKEVAKEVQIDFGEGPISEIYPKSKIVLNQAVRNDVNFRVFEAMIAGSLLVTPLVGNGLESLFEDGKHCVFYEDGNPADAISKIKYYLENEEKRAIIAENGRKKVVESHSSKAAAERLAATFEAVSKMESITDLKASFSIQTFIARTLWHLLRKDGLENNIVPLEKCLNQLQIILGDLSAKASSSLSSDFETVIIVADLICSDVLDRESYDIWLDDLIDTFKTSSYIELLETAYKSGNVQHDAKDHLSKLRQNLVEQILCIQ